MGIIARIPLCLILKQARSFFEHLIFFFLIIEFVFIFQLILLVYTFYKNIDLFIMGSYEQICVSGHEIKN